MVNARFLGSLNSERESLFKFFLECNYNTNSRTLVTTYTDPYSIICMLPGQAPNSCYANYESYDSGNPVSTSYSNPSSFLQHVHSTYTTAFPFPDSTGGPENFSTIVNRLLLKSENLGKYVPTGAIRSTAGATGGDSLAL